MRVLLYLGSLFELNGIVNRRSPLFTAYSGKYATVRRCRERTSGRQFAAKFLRKRNRSKDNRGEILHEVAVLEACKPCPRVVNLHQVFESNNEMVLLLEL
ncbi:unnamed protein product, partial [Nesidiocoris tenuis]